MRKEEFICSRCGGLLGEGENDFGFCEKKIYKLFPTLRKLGLCVCNGDHRSVHYALPKNRFYRARVDYHGADL